MISIAAESVVKELTERLNELQAELDRHDWLIAESNRKITSFDEQIKMKNLELADLERSKHFVGANLRRLYNEKAELYSEVLRLKEYIDSFATDLSCKCSVLVSLKEVVVYVDDVESNEDFSIYGRAKVSSFLSLAENAKKADLRRSEIPIITKVVGAALAFKDCEILWDEDCSAIRNAFELIMD